MLPNLFSGDSMDHAWIPLVYQALVSKVSAISMPLAFQKRYSLISDLRFNPYAAGD